MENKHTPGPWKYGETPSLDGQGIAFEVDTDGFTVAHVYPSFDSANAALIAAAPDMRDAVYSLLAEIDARCEDMRDAGCYEGTLLTAIEEARAALAKAEGR